jgi:signal peptidase I
VIRWLAAAAVLLGAIGWFVALRPQALGGPTAYILVSGTSMEPTIHVGSLVVVQRQTGYRVGQVVAYRIPDGGPAAGLNVIHRIVGGSADGFVMRGDNAPATDLWRPKTGDILGSAELVIPSAAAVITVLRSPALVASVAAGLAVFFVLGFWPSHPEGDGRPRITAE